MTSPAILYSIRSGRSLIPLGGLDRRAALAALRDWRRVNRRPACLHEEQVLT